jgi:hypothetical protein
MVLSYTYFVQSDRRCCPHTFGFHTDAINFAWLRWDGTTLELVSNTVAQSSAPARVNITLDLLVFLLPILRMLKFNVSTNKMIAVLAVFLFGLFVTICGVVRLQYVLQWGTSKNPSWQYNPLAIWSSIECDLGQILLNTTPTETLLIIPNSF